MHIESNLVAVAKRENNKKRSYLIVNPLQGKHVPVSPGKSLEIFEMLANKVKLAYEDEKILFIGFAETATAIGSHIAISVGGKYIQTTREIIEDVNYLFFSEAHSHATEQKLVKEDIESVIDEVDRVVFVEDEVTTGNTILNIVNILKENYGDIRFGVASIINGMDEESKKIYQDMNIDCHYLLKTNNNEYADIAEGFTCNGKYVVPNFDVVEVSTLVIDGHMDARRVQNADEYLVAVENLWDKLKQSINVDSSKTYLVIGTEECMYPAIYIGKQIEETGCYVRTHSTTRSPISVSNDEGYPLHTRYELRSLYDDERVTFIYNLDKYDEVIIVTDSKLQEIKGEYSVVNAIGISNEKLTLVRWS